MKVLLIDSFKEHEEVKVVVEMNSTELSFVLNKDIKNYNSPYGGIHVKEIRGKTYDLKPLIKEIKNLRNFIYLKNKINKDLVELGEIVDRVGFFSNEEK